MIKKFTAIYIIFFTIQISLGQYKQLSSSAEVSIITAGPGNVLFESFGHSTIRIQDKILGIDDAYNYGIFDFDTPNFYLNFVKGNLFYKLEKYPFRYFVRSYKRQRRWVKEQILNLNQAEKQQFFEYLENNAKPENAFYSYDPFFNNCATKLRDITELVLQEKVTFSDAHLLTKISIRKLTNKEIPWNSWGSFGINLALGNRLDKIASAKEYMYLPDYILSGFKNATINNNQAKEKLILKEHYILNYKELKHEIADLNPLLVFSILMIIGVVITFFDYKKNKRSRWLDFILFFTTGLIGSLIVFLWFFTNHSTAPNNFNFLWAFAPNLVVAFYISKKISKKWIKKYVKFLLVLFAIIPFIWLGKIQELPTSVMPILILLVVRYLFLTKKLLPSKK